MKKIMFSIVGLLFSVYLFGQDLSIPVPAGTDTTFTQKFKTRDMWSIHYDYSSLDNTDGTLGIYGSNFHPDSGSYIPLWIDLNLDGANDNPITLDTSADSAWGPWGREFPYEYLIEIFTKGSNTSGQIDKKTKK